MRFKQDGKARASGASLIRQGLERLAHCYAKGRKKA
jgi:hypothetical protein